MATSAVSVAELRAVIVDAIGVDITSATETLRNYVPNSLSYMQMLVAVEDRYSVSLDYREVIDEASSLEDLTSCVQAAVETAAEDGVHVVAEDKPEFAEVPLTGNSQEILLNPIQTAYVLGADEGLELGGSATFIYVEAQYPQSPSAVAAAVAAVVDRHDVLACELDVDRGVLRNTGRCRAEVEIISPEEAPTDLAVMRERLKTRARGSNESGPPVVARILREGDRTRILVYFNMIVMDAGSVYIFFDEVSTVLAGRALASATEFAEATAAVATRRRTDRRKVDLDYWERKAGSFPERPDFPVTIDGDATWSTRRLGFVLDGRLTEELSKRAHGAGVSVSSLVLAVNAAVLCHWLNVPALTVNVTVSDRSSLTRDTLVMGDFTSSMLVGVDPCHADSVTDLARVVDRDMREGLAHRTISGIEVLQRFLRSGRPQQEASAPVVFTSYLGGSQAGGSQTMVDHVYTQTAQVCLDMQVMPVRDGVSMSWDVVDDYFPAADAMFSKVREILTTLATDDAAGGTVAVDNLPVGDGETDHALRIYNDTCAPVSDATLLDLVRRSVDQVPDCLAVRLRSRGVEYTYHELWERAGRVARHLLDSGVAPGDRVIVRYTKHPDDVVNIIGVLRAGAVYVPVDATMPGQRQELVREAAGVIAPALDTDSVVTPAGAAVPDPSVSPDEPAYIIFTSGTTGRPKGVTITHRNCVNTILDVNRRFGVTGDDRIIGLSSLGFDLSVYDIFGVFAAGAALTMVGDERDADEIIDVLQGDRVTLWNSAPALLELALLRTGPQDSFPDVRTVMLSGDRIASGLPARAMAIFPNASVYSLGGATEGSIWSIYFPLQRDSMEKRIPYGYPLTNQGIHVLGIDGAPCPVGTSGEIFISGTGVAAGYAGAPEKTAAAFVTVPGLGRCYRTGDIGLFNSEGFVEFLGRRDRQVKISGHRIELGEIESVLERSGLVATSVAAPIPHGQRDLLVCLYVPAHSGVTVSAVRAELVKWLPGYMFPGTLLAVDRLPVTVNGKLDQDRVRALVEVDNTSVVLGQEKVSSCPADSAILSVVREVWEEVLNTDLSGHPTDASFFNLGGDSLQFQMMMRQVRERTGVRLHFREVIQEPTIACVAGLVSRDSATAATATPGPVAGSTAAEYSAAPAAAPADLVESRDMLSLNQEDPYGEFPLTDMQMAYYVGRNSGFELGGVTEHYYLESVTDADPGRLEESLDILVQRHPMLRAVFTDHATQRILPDVPSYRIVVEDHRFSDPETLERAIHSKREDLSHQVFDLGRWPLFDLSAFALPDGRYRLFFSVDMIIGDGASQRIFLGDLSRIYAGEVLPATTGDYRSYVLALKERVQRQVGGNSSTGESRGELLSTVREQFPAGNILPSACDSALIDAPRMRRLTHTFPAAEAVRLRTAARAADGSVSAALLACYATSLSLWAEGDSVGINVTTYNRDPDLAPVDGVFGDFTGVVLVPVIEPTRHDLAWLTGSLRRQLLEHMAEGYSGVRLLGDIGRRRGLSVGQAVAPFVFTSLLFESAGRDSRDGKDGAVDSIFGNIDYAISQTPQVLLDNQVMEVNGALSVSWDYVEQILDPVMMADIFDHFVASVSRFAAGEQEAAPLRVGPVRRLRQFTASDHRQGRDPEKPAIVRGHVSGTGNGASVALVRELAVADCGRELASNEDLFLAGLDSLSFVQLVQKVQDRTGRQIPLAQALARPTIGDIAALVDRTGDIGRGGSLVLLRQGCPEHPVFLVHGGFGTVDIYRDLALGIPGDGQVWGLSFREFEQVYPQTLTIEEIAARYSLCIREVVPPSVAPAVIGWSLGGTLAAEIAVQLRDMDPDLVFLDSLAPGVIVDVGSFEPDSEREFLASVLPVVAGQGERSDSSGEQETVPGLWEWFSAQAVGLRQEGDLIRDLAATVSPDLVTDLGLAGTRVNTTEFSTLRTLISARSRYMPTTRFPRALFILPDDGEAWNHFGWEETFVDDLRVRDVEGDHYSFVLGDGALQTSVLIGEYLRQQTEERSGWRKHNGKEDR